MRYCMIWLGLVCLLVCQFPAETFAAGHRVGLSGFSAKRYPQLSFDVTVTDKETLAPVKGLKQGDFFVSIDGKSQQDFIVESVLSGGKRIAVALLVDTSGSMAGEPLDSAKLAIGDMLQRLSSSDAACIVDFSHRVRSGSFTADRDRLKSDLDRLRAGGWTALYDALLAASQLVSSQDSDRKVIVVLTDGKDTSSRISYAQCLERLQDSGIPVYVIGLGRDVAVDRLREIAATCGGSSFFAASPTDLQAIYQAIAEKLQNRYVAEVTAPNFLTPGSWHRLSVEAGGGSASLEFMAAAKMGGSADQRSAPNIQSYVIAGVAALAVLNVVAIVGYASRKRRVSKQQKRV